MAKEIIMAQVQSLDNRICMAMLEDRKIVEVRIANDLIPSEKTSNVVPQIGDIYIGRVEKVVPSINAAFVEIAPGVSCYYPLKGNDSPIFTKKIGKKAICEGEELIVQVDKESIKSKQASVTSNINFKGVYTVLTTGNKSLGVSSKMSKNRKSQLQDLLRPFVEEDFGLIARTNAGSANDQEVMTEVQKLIAESRLLKEKAQTRTCFTLLKKNSYSYINFIEDVCNQNISKILIEDEVIYKKIKEYLELNKPELLGVLVKYDDISYPLSKLHSLDTRIEDALSKKVWLNSGGFLVIEHTEALTVIDVNSGKFVTKKNPEEAYLKLNIEAAKEIARQIRLRNISGIIIVDFINMKNDESTAVLIEQMKREITKDRVSTQVLGMTRLHLLEITRKKTYKSLWESVYIK